MGMYIKVASRLPTTYQEVAYLQSSGVQYIDTGWHPQTIKIGIEFKVSCLGTMATKSICGSEQTSATGGRWLFTLYGQNDAEKQYPLIGTWNNSSGSSYYINTPLNEDVQVSLTYNNGVTSCVSSSTESWSHTQTGDNILSHTQSFYLFQNGTTQKSSIKMYYFKIYDNDVIVRNFIPCYRKSDSKPGMYDLVNNVFYTNSATGADFTTGPAVSSGLVQVASCIKTGPALLNNTVRFISEDELYQLVSVKTGNKVSEPTTAPSARLLYWSETEGGSAVTFPFIPVSDMNLYAVLRGGLPSDYQEVSYLQSNSTGTCYIDSGIKAENGTDFEADFTVVNTAGWAGVVGCRQASGQYRYWLIYQNTGFEVGLNKDQTSAIACCAANTRYVHRLETYTSGGWKSYFKDNVSGEFVVDKTGSDTAPSTLGSLYLFAVHYTNENTANMFSKSLQIHSCKMWQTINGSKTLVRYFIPCYRKSDDEPGMYDLINDVFYDNDGSGSFTVGPDVS